MSDTVKKNISFKVKCTKFTHVKAATKKARLVRAAESAEADRKAAEVVETLSVGAAVEAPPIYQSQKQQVWTDENPPPPPPLPDEVMEDVSDSIADVFATFVPDFVEVQNHPVPSLLAMSDEEFEQTSCHPEDSTDEQSSDETGGLPMFNPSQWD